MAAMTYGKWKTNVLNHLIKYKEECLGITSSGVYLYRGEAIEKGHILPDNIELRRKNYLFDDNEFIDRIIHDNGEAHLHTNAHHLNSSQTMCLNFFYGLIHYNLLPRLLSDIGIENDGINGDRLYAEYIEKESNEKTNFDFWLETSNEVQVFFEIKYTEDGFSQKTSARNEEEIWQSVYMPLCNKSLNLKSISKDDFLTEHFQVNRNVLRARRIDDSQKKSYVVFLTMRSNPATYAEMTYVAEKKYNQVCTIYWEDILQQIMQYPLTDEGREYFERFKMKYIDIED